MKILIDIGHPAHVHLFKHFAWEMEKKGHEILFTCREKEFEIYLLEKYGFRHKSFGKKYNSLSGKIWGMIEFDIKEFLIGLKFKPDILLSAGSIYAAHAAFFLRKPHISLEDTGNNEQVRIYNPFTSVILTSYLFPANYGDKQIRYAGHHEMAYLHPRLFTPDDSVYRELGIHKQDPFIIIRLVAWQASHDVGQKGLNRDKLQPLVHKLSKDFKIFISSEKPLPESLNEYRYSISPDKIHDALYYAFFVISEGTTMAMEAAILGTPTIYINTLQYWNVIDMEKYNLLYRFQNDTGIFEKIQELLKVDNRNQIWEQNRQKMLADKIDVTAFLVWFVEHYPESAKVMKEEPEEVEEWFK